MKRFSMLSATFVVVSLGAASNAQVLGPKTQVTPPPGPKLPGATVITPPPPPPAPAPSNVPPPPAPVAATPILIGTGVEDITGPAADIPMMGYAKSDQLTAGLHMRLWARAFVFVNPKSGKRVAFVSAELGQMFSSIKQGVMKQLAAMFPGVYTDENVMLAATHTHAGPGGYSHHALYNMSAFGFIPESYTPIVNGIASAIAQAHRAASTGTMKIAVGALEDISRNRSADAYVRNKDAVVDPPNTPPARQRNVNRTMTVVRIDRPTGTPSGVIAWFSVHNTSLTQGNTLISSDNKGMAAYLFEKSRGTILPDQNRGAFVAAFPNGDEGDVSPNTGPNFTGPNNDEYVSAEIVGRAQFQKAEALFSAASTNLGGDIDFRHLFVNMPGRVVQKSGKPLCRAAYGMSFAAGAEDGRSGVPGFVEGMTMYQYSQNVENLRNAFATRMPAPLATAVRAIVPQVTLFQDPCQHPKPVLLPTGALANWTPNILPFQILRVGNLAILGVPGEMTSMAGARLRKAVEASLRAAGVTHVVITGLANEYSGYITTPEEYDAQQYEGASTIFGRHTYDAYEEVFQSLAASIAAKTPLGGGPTPPDLSRVQITTILPVIYDDKRIVEQFGQVMDPGQTARSVSPGASIKAKFRAGHPRNDLRFNDTHFLVERNVGGQWQRVAWDAMPETRFSWWRDHSLDCKACSFAETRWVVPAGQPSGRYRFRYFGTALVGGQGKKPFQGIWEFDVR